MKGFITHSGSRMLRLLMLLWICGCVAMAQQEMEEYEMTCEADGTCTDSSATSHGTSDGRYLVQVINDSRYRADVYWDDGRFGVNLATVEPHGGTVELETSVGHSFFVTRHGVREGLYHVQSDTQVRFEQTGSSAGDSSQTRWIIPKAAAPSSNPCQDRYGICPTEAARGSCHTTPGWMIVHCCKSCDAYMDASRLIDPKVRCSKENLNTTDPIWKPGDLDKLFIDWATSPEYAPYEPMVLSTPFPELYGNGTAKKGPWVVIFDNFLSSKEADALIRGGEMVGFDRSTDQGAVNAAGEMEKVVSKARTSSNAWCIGACEALPEVNAITQRIERVTSIPRSHYESFQVLEYTSDQFYRMHHDSSSNKDDSPSGHRILTFFLYLSDVEEGGETMFNKLDLAVKPKKGRALVWPSVMNENPTVWDPRMYHEAKSVIRGKKYAANHWIHLNDYVTPNIWGCTGSFS